MLNTLNCEIARHGTKLLTAKQQRTLLFWEFFRTKFIFWIFPMLHLIIFNLMKLHFSITSWSQNQFPRSRTPNTTNWVLCLCFLSQNQRNTASRRRSKRSAARGKCSWWSMRSSGGCAWSAAWRVTTVTWAVRWTCCAAWTPSALDARPASLTWRIQCLWTPSHALRICPHT